MGILKTVRGTDLVKGEKSYVIIESSNFFLVFDIFSKKYF